METISDSTSNDIHKIYLDLCTPDPFSNEVPHPDCSGLLRVELGGFNNGHISVVRVLRCTSQRKCERDDEEKPCKD